jgi:hypothetical protein
MLKSSQISLKDIWNLSLSTKNQKSGFVWKLGFACPPKLSEGGGFRTQNSECGIFNFGLRPPQRIGFRICVFGIRNTELGTRLHRLLIAAMAKQVRKKV